MALIASASERTFEREELFVWMTDAGGVLRAADPVFQRLCGEDPAGQAYDQLAEPVPEFDQPRATLVKHATTDGGVFWAMVFTLPVPAGVLGIGFKPVDRDGTFLEEIAARRDRRVRGDTTVATLRELLGGVSQRLERHVELADTFAAKSAFVVELAEEIRLFSLNAILAAHRVSDAAAIGAVAQLMQTRSDATGPEILALQGAIEHTATLLSDTRFRAAAGELLAEALLEHPDVPLAEPLADTTEAAFASLAALELALDRLAAVSASVDSHLKMLRFLELQGRIEAARAHDTEHVRMLFEEIGVQVRRASAELNDFITLGTRRHREDMTVAREARRQAARLSRTASPETR